ncbi:GNAT family N-acetyltransferase [Vibrio mediterranei]|uniref:GNAT family N-acetyltransferase n=1 Tax=Vibrio mediterranei TaxID=689 RepID=UPI00148D5F24|nr:GNAT family N-acetyltransferase [Vibrio mediterranei]NOH31501.1 GNAT family N-acetyltransferase [Vibrio mediterranei]
MAIQLISQRLKLRQISLTDWDFFYYLQTNLTVIKHCFNPRSQEQIRERFESRLLPWTTESNFWLCLVLEEIETNNLVGITGFYLQDSIAELGYMIAPEHSRKGYATESLKCVIQFATNCDIQTLQANVTQGNHASEKVLLKCGFHRDEVVEQDVELGGIMYDDLIYRKFIGR